MFHIVVVDTTGVTSDRHRRMFSCFKLVADTCVPATMYLNSDWAKMEALTDLNLKPEELTASEISILLERELFPKSGDWADQPPLVYLENGSWEISSNDDSGLPVSVPNREFVLSESDIVNRASLQSQGVNATTAILCLAAVGLDIMLPNVSFDLMADEEVDRIRDAYSAERVAYLEAVTALAHGTFERLSQSSYNDLIRWAQNETLFSLSPKARILEESIAKASKSTLRRAGYSFWKDGVPAIGSSYLASGLIGASAVTAEHALRAILSAVGGEGSRRTLPEVGYAMKIRAAT